MKIVVANCYFTPRIGGAEKYCHYIAHYLGKDHEVNFITSEEISFKKDLKTPIAELADETFKVHYVPYHQISKYKFPQKSATKELLKKLNPDIILINGPLPYSTIFGIIAKSLKIPVILTYQGDANPSNPLIKLAARIERLSYSWIFNRLILTTPKYQNRASKFFPRSRTSVVQLAVEDEFLTERDKNKCRQKHRLEKDKKYILFVAKLDGHHYYKGIDTFIETSKLLPEYQFLVVGDGEDRSKLEQQTKNQKNITFLGRLSREDLIEYYNAVDLFVLPSSSSSEGFGLVLLEAAACNTPVITTEAVGSSEFIKETEIGLIIPPKNPTALKENIEKLLTNQTLYQKFQKNCHKTAKTLTWKTSSDLTYEVLNKTLNQCQKKH